MHPFFFYLNFVASAIIFFFLNNQFSKLQILSNKILHIIQYLSLILHFKVLML